MPEKSWLRFRDIFADYCDKMKEGGGTSGTGGNSLSDKGNIGNGQQSSSPSNNLQQPISTSNLDSNLIK